MDKMAQWKSSILGINKSSHGGPVKGKMPMSAPMAKYANGGKVVKKAEGGKVSFAQAFRNARKAMESGNGGKTFTWNGKSYSTRKKEESPDAFKKMDFGGQKYISDKAGLDKDPMLQRAARESELAAKVKEESDYNERNDAEESARKEYPGYAKGGKVMAKGGAADMKQDKAMIARHNRLMHPGQKSKLMNGGMVNKYSDGNAVKKDPYASDKTQGLGMMMDKEAKIASMKRAKDYPSNSKSDYAKQFKSDYANRRKDMLIVTPDNEDYMSGRISGRERQDKAKRDNALNAYANRGKDYIKDKLDDVDVAISKKIGLKERARTKESFREGLKEEGYNTGGKVMKKGGGGAMRVQGDMKRPQFSASKSFDGGKTRIGMSAGKGNFRASFSKKFADGGAVTRLANEASGVISDMTKNRTMMKKGGSVKKGSMMKAKGSMMKAMSNKR